MKLVSSIIALAVFGQVAPALAVCALCPMQKSLSDFFWIIQTICCPSAVNGSPLLQSTTLATGWLYCVYSNRNLGSCYYVSTQVCPLRSQMSHPLDRTPKEPAIIAEVIRHVPKLPLARYQICSASTKNYINRILSLCFVGIALNHWPALPMR